MLDYAEFAGVDWGRTRASLATEWTGHDNWSFVRTAQDIDFDKNEEGFTIGDYNIKAVKRAWLGFKSLFGLN